MTAPIAPTTDTDVARLEHLDPRELSAHPRNVRGDLGDLAELTASIREQGVLQPLTVAPVTDHGYRIVAGHRRAAAAVAAELPLVPCIVRTDLAEHGGDERAVHAEHVGAMLAENLHREGLTAQEEARGIKQMLDLGVPIFKVAKRTGLSQKRVKKAIGVTRLDDASLQMVDEYQLDLDQAAAVALFAGDGEAIGRLITSAKEGPGRFAHALEREKQSRKAQQAYEARVAELRAEGRVVVDEASWSGAKNRRLTGLTSQDRTWLGSADAETAHRSCPGSAVAVSLHWGQVEEVEVCTDFAANGHVDRSSSPTQAAKPETPEEKEAASAERRRVIENNKAMAAANTVRRRFVKELLARRSAPPEVLRFAVEEIAADPSSLRSWLGSESTIEKDVDQELGIQKPVRSWSSTRADHEGKPATLTTGEHVPDARLPLQLLAHIAGGVESSIPKDGWRRGSDTVVRWLRFLAGLGYTLSDVEQGIVDGAAK